MVGSDWTLHPALVDYRPSSFRQAQVWPDDWPHGTAGRPGLGTRASSGREEPPSKCTNGRVLWSGLVGSGLVWSEARGRRLGASSVVLWSMEKGVFILLVVLCLSASLCPWAAGWTVGWMSRWI